MEIAMRESRNCWNGTGVGTLACVVASFVVFSTFTGLFAEGERDRAGSDHLAAEYPATIVPLMKRYCLRCHSTEKQKGELDLERFTGVSQLREDLEPWRKVIEMLDNGEMPPEKSRQPSAEERQQIVEWVQAFLDAEARANAGDPGRVVVRRLSNAEYNATLRDLTGVDLEPARQFPADGAAGEGFTNAGIALVMSPSLLEKYLAAARRIAAHAVLLPDGLRFSASDTRSDWTDEAVESIQSFYRKYVDEKPRKAKYAWKTERRESTAGYLPLEPYLKATLAYRKRIADGEMSLKQVAEKEGLSFKYLRLLWQVLNDREPSRFLDRARAQWLSSATNDMGALFAEIEQWQEHLWKFQSVGYFEPWQVPHDPLIEGRTLKTEVSHGDAKSEKAGEEEDVFYLVARDTSDGNDGDYVTWQRPRFEIEGRQPILLRDLPRLDQIFKEKFGAILAQTTSYLDCVAEVRQAGVHARTRELAEKRGLHLEILESWISYVGFAGRDLFARPGMKLYRGPPPKRDRYFSQKRPMIQDHSFLNGWGPAYYSDIQIFANSSDVPVNIPGRVDPHRIAVQPMRGAVVMVTWRSPLSGLVRVEGRVSRAADDRECGDITWSLEQRRGKLRWQLPSGAIEESEQVAFGPVDRLLTEFGDYVSLTIGPRNELKPCNLTDIDLSITEIGGEGRKWNLVGDVADDVLAGNPHADRLGNNDVWHFYYERVEHDLQARTGLVPGGSLLMKWRDTLGAEPGDDASRAELATKIQRLLTAEAPPPNDGPDAVLYRELTVRNGPLFRELDLAEFLEDDAAVAVEPGVDDGRFHPHVAAFGRHPLGQEVEDASLVIQAPSVLEIRFPTKLVGDREFVVDASLHADSGLEGTVQLEILDEKPADMELRADLPVIVNQGSAARRRLERDCEKFRQVFPAALCFRRVIPVGEVVTLERFHRSDDHLSRLMLGEAEKREIDKLWDELLYVSQQAREIHDTFQMFQEFNSQNNETARFEPFREPVRKRAEAFERELVASEPSHVVALVEFAARAYRRPLGEDEESELRALYQGQRDAGYPHEEAVQTTLASILVSPHFLYRVEEPAPGHEAHPVSDFELATRLSYFLWSSLPDAELLQLAEGGGIREPGMLVGQVRRLLGDERVRSLAVQFATQWLDVRDFDEYDDKNGKLFPTFDAALRKAINEEAIVFFVDLFRRDGSVLEILNADHTFLDETLARHYGIPGIEGPQWRRVDEVSQYSRGGILTMASVLAKQSGASRTSPILRGNFVLEFLLGVKLPNPPPQVPDLPEAETDTGGLTLRELVEKHRSQPECATCHDKIDPFGFALEGFDTIGRAREKDMAGRPVDLHVELPGGAKFLGARGLRDYLLTERRDEFLRNFSKKLLGYALGRGVTLSDESLLDEMLARLEANDYRFSSLVETIVTSRQFQYHRGRAKDVP